MLPKEKETAVMAQNDVFTKLFLITMFKGCLC